MHEIVYKYEKFYAPAGRILVGAFFLLAGVSKIMGIGGTAGYIASVGLPMATLLAWVAAIFLILAGAALITGYRAKCAAFLLALYVILVTVLFHPPSSWSAENSQQIMFMKNVAILGGLLFMTRHLPR